jgi:hypothetical protein
MNTDYSDRFLGAFSVFLVGRSGFVVAGVPRTWTWYGQ